MSWDDDVFVPDDLAPEGLREDIETLAAVLRGIAPRVDGMDHRLAEAETTVLRADRQVQELERTCRTLAGQLKRLSARVEWMERNIRRGGEDEVPLDDVPAGVLRLARTAEEGREERARLLADEARTSLETLAAEHSSAVNELVTVRRAALAECELLAGTPWSDSQHRAAADRFSGLMTRYRATRAEVTRLAGPALAAAAELAQDEERALDGAGAIEAGEQAWQQLLVELRTRLADAVGEGALLPEWFTAVLGPIPAAAETAEWMDTGTDLLAYRITYGVRDPSQALGHPPPARPAHRAEWHHRLDRHLRRLDARR